MWGHVARYNLAVCKDPLHGFHQIPVDPPINYIDIDYLYRAAKYAEMTLNLFDTKTGVTASTPSAFDELQESLSTEAESVSDESGSTSSEGRSPEK